MNNSVLEQNEILENRIAANKTVAFLVMAIGAFILNVMDVFYVDKVVFAVAMSIMIVCCVLIQVFGRVEKLAKKSSSKFVILFLLFLVVLSTTSLLNFHAILMLCYPMIIAINYRSKHFARMTFVVTIITALLWPIISVKFEFIQPSYLIFLLDVLRPDLVEIADLEQYLVAKGCGFKEVILFVSLPQMGFAFVFGMIVLISNKKSSAAREKIINELKESRDQILAGMSDIVDGRDLGTGGHVKRANMVVKYLVDAMKEDKEMCLVDEEFADYVVRTASMHDLGKIAIPDAILNKPGKLSTEEFEFIMIHPQKSSDMIKRVLAGLKDEKLLKIADNIALYHHERFDGSGYPKGLKGEEIPLEARIMAIADVYDALVSRRCYKKQISHEEAYNVIEKSMGAHFDPQLWKYFDKAYPDIVEYYS